MYPSVRLIVTLLIHGVLLLSLNGCANLPQDPSASLAIDGERLPTPDLSLNLDGLGPCTDQPDRTLRLKRGEPVHVLVHGCNASAGRFRTLAPVFAHQGQQAICYTYDDRRSLAKVASELRLGLEQLAAAASPGSLSLIAHSQGGLIARHAMRETDGETAALDRGHQQLITLSTPFSGIRAADHCASPVMRIISFGLVVPLCRAISGEKWYEITHASDFVQAPGRLRGSVSRHLLISTDERQTCRRYEGEQCVQDDYVFSLDEQALPAQAMEERVIEQVLRAGHAQVVGTGRHPPQQLISLLQEQGVLSQTPLSQLPGFRRYLSQLYAGYADHPPGGRP